MAKSESVQKRLQKVRPPRVQMTYDVEIGDTIANKELPFVVGVLGDFGGSSEQDKKRLKDRKFIDIDAGNFDDVLAGVEPVASFNVANRISEDGGEFGVKLTFREFADFRPEAIVAQVQPLRKLLEAREKLADLRNKMAGNDALEDLLGDVLRNTVQMRSLSTALPKKEA